LRLDRLRLDPLLGQESGDRREVGIDLLLNAAEIVAGRGDPKRPDREVGGHEGFGQPLDGDVAVGGAPALEAAADQETGAQEAKAQNQGAQQSAP
jgi:hypothetical protein